MSIKSRVIHLEKGARGLFPLPTSSELTRYTDDQLTYTILQGVYEVTGDPEHMPVLPLPEITEEALLHVVNTGVLPENWNEAAID